MQVIIQRFSLCTASLPGLFYQNISNLQKKVSFFGGVCYDKSILKLGRFS